ncbi:MAG: hypothetical protein FWD73_07130 [Polyangiaceae bacterium]|nr:hypothetical protein [Polyangiaceae bacterium]
MMGRFKVAAKVEAIVDGEDGYDAIERFDEAICAIEDGDKIKNVGIGGLDLTQIPYVVPPGAERWAKAAEKIRFADEMTLAGTYDGSWWWTNGHVALRCDGAAPDGWDLPPGSSMELVVSASTVRKPTEWGPVVRSGNERNDNGRRAFASDSTVVSATYYDMITDSVPGAIWLVGSKIGDSMHVVDKAGKLVAILMGILPMSFPPLDAPARAS